MGALVAQHCLPVPSKYDILWVWPTNLKIVFAVLIYRERENNFEPNATTH